VRSVDGIGVPFVTHRERRPLRIVPQEEGAQISVNTLANPSQGLFDLVIYPFGRPVDELRRSAGDNFFEPS
jgi:hypothetical protein